MAQSSSAFRRRFSRAAGLAVTGMLVATAQASADDGQILREQAPTAIPESYIVVLEDDTASRRRDADRDRVARQRARRHVEHRYLNSVRGFSATMTREQALELSTDPAVAYVEQNRTLTTMDTQTPTPSWGLDRIDQRDLPLNNAFTYPNTGAGVTAYIIDTGIRTSATAPSAGARAGAPTPPTTATTATATGTARTWPARSAARPTAWPRA